MESLTEIVRRQAISARTHPITPPIIACARTGFRLLVSPNLFDKGLADFLYRRSASA